MGKVEKELENAKNELERQEKKYEDKLKLEKTKA
jgi:hypothetical protein